ncbi:hypothetical protein I4000191A8_17850 [Clostridia bacterium i40-0019-1A8]
MSADGPAYITRQKEQYKRQKDRTGICIFADRQVNSKLWKIKARVRTHSRQNLIRSQNESLKEIGSQKVRGDTIGRG